MHVHECVHARAGACFWRKQTSSDGGDGWFWGNSKANSVKYDEVAS